MYPKSATTAHGQFLGLSGGSSGMQSTSPAQLSSFADRSLDSINEAFLRKRYRLPFPAPLDLNSLQFSEKPNIQGFIDLAIWSSADKQLTSRGIREAVVQRFPSYANKDGWRRSIRHALSLKDRYINHQRPGNGPRTKGGFWTLDARKGNTATRQLKLKQRKESGSQRKPATIPRRRDVGPGVGNGWRSPSSTPWPSPLLQQPGYGLPSAHHVAHPLSVDSLSWPAYSSHTWGFPSQYYYYPSPQDERGFSPQSQMSESSVSPLMMDLRIPFGQDPQYITADLSLTIDPQLTLSPESERPQSTKRRHSNTGLLEDSPRRKKGRRGNA